MQNDSTLRIPRYLANCKSFVFPHNIGRGDVVVEGVRVDAYCFFGYRGSNRN